MNVDIKTKNKYAICFSLYDNYKVSETNLYYYKGLIKALSFSDRNFDIYIDTTEYCKEKLLEVVNQENLSLDNVYFIIHEESDLSSGMLWRIKTLIEKLPQYDCIGTSDSDSLNSNDFFYYYEQYPSFGIYNNTFNVKNHNLMCWKSRQLYQGGNTYICHKNLKTNYNKILQNITQICNCKKLKKPYEFDELYITSLFINEAMNNNICYIYTSKNSYNPCNLCNIKYANDKFYHINFDIYKSKYMKDKIYTVNGKQKEYTDIKPQILSKDMSVDAELSQKNLNILFNIERYMLDIIPEFNIEDFYE